MSPAAMSSNSFSGRSQVINAFLSHSYGAPGVNRFFYDLNLTTATITFRLSANSARAERTCFLHPITIGYAPGLQPRVLP